MSDQPIEPLNAFTTDYLAAVQQQDEPSTSREAETIRVIEEHHARITHLHLKDRQRNNGPNKPFGEGDTPIKQVLQFLRQKGYSIPALIEYEYQGTASPIEEVNKCLAYCRKAIEQS